MTDAHTLIPMGAGEPETFRCRIYGAAEDAEQEIKRAAFVAELAGPTSSPTRTALRARSVAGA